MRMQTDVARRAFQQVTTSERKPQEHFAIACARLTPCRVSPMARRMENSDDEILAVVEASAPRRWMAVVALSAMGGLTLYLAFFSPPALGWQVFLIAVGVIAFWVADRLRRATTTRIELTRAGLRDSAGIAIAPLATIESLDRGVFAFKPSNGFLVKTRVAGGRAWQTGMWWRLGRRIGVGGVTAASQTKAMAEILTTLMMERDGTLPKL